MSSMRTPNSPGEVDAGLDGEAHPGHQRLLLALDHVRRLVGGGADAVAGAVDELLAVAGVRDHLARPPGRSPGRRRRAARPRRRPAARGARSRAPRGCCAEGSPDAHGAAGVRAVAVHEATEVEHDRVADLDGPVTGLVVGVGAVRARADDREVDLLVAELAQQPRQVGGDVGLLPAGEPHPQDLLVRRVRGRARRLQPGELVGVLDRAEHRQALRHRAGTTFRAPHCCNPSRCIAHARVRDRHDRAVRRSSARAARERVLAVEPVHERRGSAAPAAASASGRSRVGTSSVGSSVGSQDEHGQPFGDRRGLVAGEPDQVGPGRDQQRRRGPRGRRRPRPAHPRRVVLVRERCDRAAGSRSWSSGPRRQSVSRRSSLGTRDGQARRPRSAACASAPRPQPPASRRVPLAARCRAITNGHQDAEEAEDRHHPRGRGQAGGQRVARRGARRSTGCRSRVP